MICFQRALEIMGTNMVQVPGCEPTSAMSSDVLARFNTCKCALVPLSAALEAIPGSTVRFGINTGSGVRQRWFVLPEECPQCPCVDEPDYYSILRDLCQEPEPEPMQDCEVIWDVNNCVPDAREMEKYANLPTTTYYKEGENPQAPNLWASSPWFIQQQNEEAAAGGQPEQSTYIPVYPQNKETVVIQSTMQDLEDAFE